MTPITKTSSSQKIKKLSLEEPKKPSHTSKRRLRNLLLKPRAQIELVINILTITIFFGLASCLIIYFQLNDLFNSLYSVSGMDDGEGAEIHILKDWNMTIQWLLVFIIVYVSATVLICLVHSHRMIGPTVAFQRQLKELLSGNYKARVKLRDGDYYQNIADLLNDLSEHFEKRFIKNVNPNDSGIHHITTK